jgi:hypothetical protein
MYLVRALALSTFEQGAVVRPPQFVTQRVTNWKILMKNTRNEDWAHQSLCPAPPSAPWPARTAAYFHTALSPRPTAQTRRYDARPPSKSTPAGWYPKRAELVAGPIKSVAPNSSAGAAMDDPKPDSSGLLFIFAPLTALTRDRRRLPAGQSRNYCLPVSSCKTCRHGKGSSGNLNANERRPTRLIWSDDVRGLSSGRTAFRSGLGPIPQIVGQAFVFGNFVVGNRQVALSLPPTSAACSLARRHEREAAAFLTWTSTEIRSTDALVSTIRIIPRCLA